MMIICAQVIQLYLSQTVDWMSENMELIMFWASDQLMGRFDVSVF
jgi:hypothetical protein